MFAQRRPLFSPRFLLFFHCPSHLFIYLFLNISTYFPLKGSRRSRSERPLNPSLCNSLQVALFERILDAQMKNKIKIGGLLKPLFSFFLLTQLIVLLLRATLIKTPKYLVLWNARSEGLASSPHCYKDERMDYWRKERVIETNLFSFLF